MNDDSIPFRRSKPPQRIQTTTLWEYSSQHYLAEKPGYHGRRDEQGDKKYEGATPSWVIWQLLQRYTRSGDVVVDPMCGGGTTLDVCHDLDRKGVGFDLGPTRPDITAADARRLPMPDASADFVFVDPPYSTHIRYTEQPECIGTLDAAGDDGGEAYYDSMTQVISEIDRILRNRRYMALYISDSWRKRKGAKGGGNGTFMPIGFELFAIMTRFFKPVDIIAVARGNRKLGRSNWHKSAEEGNYFLRGFNYLFIMKKHVDDARR